jgi:WD repeat-containing protein 26
VFTPSASDDPSTPQTNISSNTVLSVPNPTPLPPPSPEQQPQSQNLTELTPAPSQPTRRGADSRRRTAQIIGRRRRSSSEDDEQGDATSGAASSAANTSSRRNPKRRRDGSMLAEVDGQETSNGTPRGASNGARVGEGMPVEASGRPPKVPPESTNGLSQNGKVDSHAPPPTYLGHDREEVTRILIQALTDMGYRSAAESVSRDSGYELESPTVAAFRTAVLDGLWTRAEELLEDAVPSGSQRQGNGLVLAEGADRNTMRVWLRQQKFLELLELRETTRALTVLRSELTPLCSEQHQKLHFLSSLLMCQSREDLKSKADWDGAHGESRRILLSELSRVSSLSLR